MTPKELEQIVRKAPKKIKKKLYAILSYDLYYKKMQKERMRVWRAKKKLSTIALDKKN